MSFKITKAKLKGEESVEYTFTEMTNGAAAAGTKTVRAAVHPDLTTAFQNLAIHLAVMTGFVKEESVDDIEIPEFESDIKFHVSSYSISDDDKKGIVISGHGILPNKKAVILNTPFRLFNEKDETRYQFMDNLQEPLDRCDKEIRAFIDGTKRGTEPQGKLDFNKEPVTVAQIMEPDKMITKAKELQEQKKITSGIGHADPEAMKRVKEMDNEPKK